MLHSPITVSIVTPVFNSSRFIGETIESVQAQTYTDWEMICVDDGSTDRSIDIIQQYAARDSRIRLLRLSRNSGTAMARNTAIEAARGRYIAFLDSDDLWLPHKLQMQLAFMQEQQAVFCFSAYVQVDEAGCLQRRIGVPARVDYRQLLKTCYIGCLTAVYDTAHFGKVYLPVMLKRQDYGLWLSLLKRTRYAHGIPEVLARYRVRSGSLSANKLNTARYTWRIYRVTEGFGRVRSAYYFSRYVVRAVLRAKCPPLARRLHLLH